MTRSAVIAAILVCCCVTVAAGSDPGFVFDPPRAPADARLKDAVTLNGYHPWKPYTDLAAWKERREAVRRQILVAAGLWPMPPKTPLRPVVHGAIDRETYTVEKVRFESYPGFHVTGNLYRPKGTGKRPAVLCPHGHWPNGRLYDAGEERARRAVDAGEEGTIESGRYPIQARCAQLARMGCVVFHYDMVGYADSRQIGHSQGFGDVEAELRLQSAFGLQTWNTVRSLDFLVGLPQVDPLRVGVTGASGGGTQTFILCAIDGRPAAAFPAVMVSTDMQGGCVCENASHLRVGTGNIEFAALAAPRPYAMTGANDWTKEIMTKGLPELKALYRSYGDEDLVEAWCHVRFGHNYNQVSREHMYDWFNRHLEIGSPSPVKEKPFVPVPPAELSVFDDNHPLPDDAVDAARLRKWLTATSEAQIAALAPSDAAGIAAFRRVIGGALEAMLHTNLPSRSGVESNEHGETLFHGHRVRKRTLRRKGSGEEVPAILIEPQEWNGVVVVKVSPDGKTAACFAAPASSPEELDLNRETRRILAAGAAILAPDLFLTGSEYAIGDAAPEEVGKDTNRHKNYVGYSYGYNRTLLAERVHDLLTAIGHARALPGCKQVRLMALDEAAAWAILARALAKEAVARVLVSPRAGWIDYSKMTDIDDPNFLPGALKYGGMASFTALCAPGEMRWVDTSAPPPLAVQVYRAAGRPDALEHVNPGDGPDEQILSATLKWIAAE